LKETQTIFASAARTATSTNTFHTKSLGGLLFINCTAASATPSVVFTVKGYDPVSSTAYTILTSSAVTGTGLTVLRIHPSLGLAPNAVPDILPEACAVTATHADADSITYSVSFIGVN
jgi:hypothetical protein